MNNKIKSPFEVAEIEIVEMNGFDVITTSIPPIGKDPFEGEMDEF